MTDELHWKPLVASETEEWRALLPSGVNDPSYRYIEPREFPSSIPESLKAKLDSAVVMASGSPGGTTYLVCNLNRIDRKDDAVDQQPFALAFDANGEVASGVYINHGNWPGRTQRLPAEYTAHVQASGIGKYFIPTIPEATREGLLSDLSESSHRHAFDKVIGLAYSDEKPADPE